MSKNIQFGDRPFAVKEHKSSFLHWDLRFQFSGQTLLSFAARTSPHLNPSEPIEVDQTLDHKLAYLLQEWIIPSDRSGAGPTVVWDKGVFRVLGKENINLQIARGHLRIFIIGGRLKGNFSLKWVGPEEKNWLWITEWDDDADPHRRFPNVLTPDKIQELGKKSHVPKDQATMDLFENFKTN